MLIDSHAHLDFPDFAGDIEGVLARAAEAGVDRILTIGTSVESSRRAVELAERHPQLYAAIGIHPSAALEEVPGAVDALRPLCDSPHVVAIGEIGLDHYRLPAGPESETLKAAQETLFRQQLDLAAERGLNVVIHQRGDCFERTFQLLAPHLGKIRAVFHCFGGTPADAARLHAARCLVSFTGIVTFKNAALMQACAEAAPEGSYMVQP
ncbi:MAG: TatD family hydrolase, partial [Chthoniobacteraceae bacterium]|nr:TatD family hydrolase [Chthoniobacteraceae bacterium]